MEDPGVSGKKLSKTDNNGLELRNKSYLKVLDLQIAYIRARQTGSPDEGDLLIRWKKKAEWHLSEFGF